MLRTSLCALVLFAVSVTALPAQQWPAEQREIMEITREHFQTLDDGDAVAHMAHHVPDATSFDAVGGLLSEARSREEQAAPLQALFDAGLTQTNELRHLKVQVYGDAAVVTGYVVGTATNPDGSTEEFVNRRTAVLIRQDGEWMEVHSPQSPLREAPQP